VTEKQTFALFRVWNLAGKVVMAGEHGDEAIPFHVPEIASLRSQ